MLSKTAHVLHIIEKILRRAVNECVSQKRGCGVNDGTVVATYPHESFSFSTSPPPNYVTLAFIRQVSVDGAPGPGLRALKLLNRLRRKAGLLLVVKHKSGVNRGWLGG
jgi:hypothetical protein